MKKVCILTDFLNHDPAYSLCNVVLNQVKMITAGGYPLRVLMRRGFDDECRTLYAGTEIAILDPGEVGSNTVEITTRSGEEIDSLTTQLRATLAGVDVVLTHDLIYQPNMWKYHIAARRVAKERPELRWLHWAHSTTGLDVVGQTGRFRSELQGRFPNSRLVVMHGEEMIRKGGLYGYEIDGIVVIPNPINLTEDYHPAAIEAIERGSLVDADVIAVYPCRLDRGKQPHIIIEVFGKLRAMGANTRVVIIDFHSVSGDKANYRDEIKKLADNYGVPVLFTSDLDYEGAHYHIPHKAVMDLLEYGDIMLHPSMSESDPLIVPEAAWKRCGLVLNFDLPVFHQYQSKALLYKFSSNVDIATGLLGSTKTEYGDRGEYMRGVAGGIAYLMSNNPVLYLHAKMRKTRSLKTVWEKHLWPAIEGGN